MKLEDLREATQCVVDGNHRFVRRFRDGFNTIQAHAIPESLWRQYLITGITPEVSQFFVEYFLVGKGRGEECIPYLGVQLKLLR